ncbi:hypothetical protein [Goodfellowiella coeruleoviolacea]|uniref:Uncharacterized protein n=1 Tax=Goodfellowiella coeruleoviolacea TaxID=334858 RepID=A0AAE3GIP3_9PSEU|nr:hypothetical protein [Goodfellowiella coeruleoviolacea]MCP2168132.1 hypothetical protein [Goodfellowiella coeruleoviolacea]
MRISYTGPHRAVTVPALGLTAERDRPIEVPDDLAAPLLDQPDWAAVKPAAKDSRKEAS